MAFETTSELITFVEKEVGHQLTGSSSQYDDILSHLDRANKMVHAGGGFLNFDSTTGKRISEDVQFVFARSTYPKVLTLLPLITSSTASATRLSNALTFSSDPNSGVSVAGWHVQVFDTDTVYRIASHTAGATAAVLDDVFTDESVTAKQVGLGKLVYTVGSSDILGILSPVRIWGESWKITVTDKDEMYDRTPPCLLNGEVPEFCSILNESDGTVTLMFNSAPDTDYYRAEIDYIPLPSTLSASVNPTMPRQYREMLGHLAIYFMQIRNDDNRAPVHLQIAQQMFRELSAWNTRYLSRGDKDYGRVVISRNFGGGGKTPYVDSPVGD
jgi:hypothetical protein